VFRFHYFLSFGLVLRHSIWEQMVLLPLLSQLTLAPLIPWTWENREWGASMLHYVILVGHFGSLTWDPKPMSVF